LFVVFPSEQAVHDDEMSQLTLRPMARAQIGLNETDFTKEFS